MENYGLNNRKSSAERTAVARTAVEKITDQATLIKTAKTNKHELVRMESVKRIFDQAALEEIIKTDRYFYVCEAALGNLTDPAILATIAESHPYPGIRMLADEKLSRLITPSTKAAVAQQRRPVFEPVWQSYNEEYPVKTPPDVRRRLCAECGRAAKSKINIQLISGIEKVTHTKKNGQEQTIKKPKAQHGFDICEDCFGKEERRVNRKRPWYILSGLLLALGGLFLAVIEINGFVNGDISLWIDTGTGVEVMPWLAVIVAIAIPLVPLAIGAGLLRNGMASSLTLVTEAFGEKLVEQTVNKLKETDRESRIFACTKESLGKDYTLKVEREADKLEIPCTLALSREKKMLGSMTGLRVFLNGVGQGILGNGKTIEMQTGLSKSMLTVVDNEDNAKTLEFDTLPGGYVRISLEFNGSNTIKFINYPYGSQLT
ncbi:MAG: hypothetical protein LBS79_00030 [Tannerella sp.]|jgi:hypothetical protein|nr:hypothetical protein [Tannerella sp.]